MPKIDGALELTANILPGHTVQIRPAPVEREWMEDTNERFAYRCLPLNIANAHGWELLCPAPFKAHWTGGLGKDDVKVHGARGTAAPALGHFGYGVLTFHVTALFRTEPGFDLMVMGPVNRPKDAIAPLTGVIETDWAPYTFTMNWKFTRPGTVVAFEAGEPFCHLFPIRRGDLEQFSPSIKKLEDDAELLRQQAAWSASREEFMRDLKVPGSRAHEEGWQKLYYRGLDADGQAVKAEDHRTRVRLKSFGTDGT